MRPISGGILYRKPVAFFVSRRRRIVSCPAGRQGDRCYFQGLIPDIFAGFCRNPVLLGFGCLLTRGLLRRFIYYSAAITAYSSSPVATIGNSFVFVFQVQ